MTSRSSRRPASRTACCGTTPPRRCADGVCTLLEPVPTAGNPDDVGGLDECIIREQSDIHYDPPAHDGVFQEGATVQAQVDCTTDDSEESTETTDESGSTETTDDSDGSDADRDDGQPGRRTADDRHRDDGPGPGRRAAGVDRARSGRNAPSR